MVNTTTHLEPHARPVRIGAAGVRTQLTLMASQLAAGAGNLVVSMVAARLLAPDAYAQVVSWRPLQASTPSEPNGPAVARSSFRRRSRCSSWPRAGPSRRPPTSP
jgi:hypothetical protein